MVRPSNEPSGPVGREHILPIVKACAEDLKLSYHQRALLLHAIVELGGELGSDEMSGLLALALPMGVGEKVANLRLLFSRAMRDTMSLHATKLAQKDKDEVKKALQSMAADDPDVDAKAFAAEGLAFF